MIMMNYVVQQTQERKERKKNKAAKISSGKESSWESP